MEAWDDDATLHAYLTAMGLGTELGQMEREDMVRLAQSMRESESTSQMAPGEDSNAQPGPPSEPSASELALDMTMEPIEAVAEAAEVTYTDAQQDTIASFVAVTAIPIDQAGPFLGAMDWNLESAINMYLETGSIPQAPTRPYNTRSAGAGLGLSDEPELNVHGENIPIVLPPASPSPHIPTSHEGFGSEGQWPPPGMFGMGGSGSVGGSGYRGPQPGGGGRRGPHVDEYDEFGIRIADQVVNERLMDDGPMGSMGGMGMGGGGGRGRAQNNNHDDPLSRAESAGVVWTGLAPPAHLSHPCGWDLTRNHAKDEKKWILVNIQLHTNFDSHQLNNHTWCDETVVELLRGNFVFWQRGSTSPDAAIFMDTYHLKEENLPYIGIMDARTGAANLTVKGFMPPEVLSMTLLDFISANDPSASRAPRFKVERSSVLLDPLHITPTF
jgi:hypothetical protein